HGAYKFSGSQALRLDVLEEIQAAVRPNFPLVMHGSSSVPRQWVDRIHAAGGDLRMPNEKGVVMFPTGVDEEQYLPAAKLGICKINIDTDGRLVWCATYRESFRDMPGDFDPRTSGKKFMPAYAEYIAHKNQMLGSAGQLESARKSLGKGS
ncbi:MAG: class II fructose-bisphosphate aldolase, partial [Planctomycetota bacterium]